MAECDARYAAKIRGAADMIAENLRQSPIVLLSGPSGSGKTTTAQKIEEELTKRGVRTYTISMDNYFRTVDPATAPRTKEGAIDFESPLCMDMELLNEHFTKLARGERILVPKYEFARQMRVLEPSKSLKLKKDEIVIFEGIHALNDDITAKHPEAFKLYISARSNVEFERQAWCSRAPGCASCAARCATGSSAPTTRTRPSPCGPTSAGAKSSI